MAQRRGKTLARYGRAGVLGGVGDCWLDSDVIPPSVDSALKFAVKCLLLKCGLCSLPLPFAACTARLFLFLYNTSRCVGSRVYLRIQLLRVRPCSC